MFIAFLSKKSIIKKVCSSLVTRQPITGFNHRQAVIETCRASETPCLLNDHMRTAHTLAQVAHIRANRWVLGEARQLLVIKRFSVGPL